MDNLTIELTFKSKKLLNKFLRNLKNNVGTVVHPEHLGGTLMSDIKKGIKRIGRNIHNTIKKPLRDFGRNAIPMLLDSGANAIDSYIGGAPLVSHLVEPLKERLYKKLTIKQKKDLQPVPIESHAVSDAVDAQPVAVIDGEGIRRRRKAISSYVNNKVAKGSKEAKDKMAYLRSLRKTKGGSILQP